MLLAERDELDLREVVGLDVACGVLEDGEGLLEQVGRGELADLVLDLHEVQVHEGAAAVGADGEAGVALHQLLHGEVHGELPEVVGDVGVDQAALHRVLEVRGEQHELLGGEDGVVPLLGGSGLEVPVALGDHGGHGLEVDHHALEDLVEVLLDVGGDADVLLEEAGEVGRQGLGDEVGEVALQLLHRGGQEQQRLDAGRALGDAVGALLGLDVQRGRQPRGGHAGEAPQQALVLDDVGGRRSSSLGGGRRRNGRCRRRRRRRR